MKTFWRIRAEHVGHDDWGNQVYVMTAWNPFDPDDCESWLETEFIL
jgi:hypothetical protein